VHSLSHKQPAARKRRQAEPQFPRPLHPRLLRMRTRLGTSLPACVREYASVLNEDEIRALEIYFDADFLAIPPKFMMHVVQIFSKAQYKLGRPYPKYTPEIREKSIVSPTNGRREPG
jgi:hypothetical protein